jgi:uncharacterized protein (TIGR00251 family)
MKIVVKANSSKNEISFDKERNLHVVYIKAKPEQGKANVEVEKFLSKHFGKQVRIKSGFSSKTKIVDFV